MSFYLSMVSYIYLISARTAPLTLDSMETQPAYARSERVTQSHQSKSALSKTRFSPYLTHDVDPTDFGLGGACGCDFAARGTARRAKSDPGDQIAGSKHCSPLGAVVLQLSGRTQKRRLVENGQRQSAGEILFRFGLERRRRWQIDAFQISNCRSSKRHCSR